jgi:N-acetylglucosaminyldiphosphoundecaprenol N-acetyl-beta-D-mannosaminyltransferase
MASSPTSSCPSGLPRRHLFGLDFVEASGEEALVEHLLAVPERGVAPGCEPVLVTPNVDQLVKLERNADEVAVALVRRAGWVLPDGQPIVWAARLLGEPLGARLAGSTIVHLLWPRIVEQGLGALVIASSDDIAARISADHPGAVALVAPRLRLDEPATFDEFVDRCLEAVAGRATAFVFVTVGFPRQERLIRQLLDQWPADVRPPLFCAIGASFEMHYGLKKRAPQWMQRAGLEWFFRFIQEPRRLFRRYFIDDVAFVPIVWREWRERRRG